MERKKGRREKKNRDKNSKKEFHIPEAHSREQ
jgi:hypothetical protein